MTDEERLRQQLDEELGDIQVRAGSRERLRQGMRGRRKSRWFRASVMVPVAAAMAIAALVLSIPLLLDRPGQRVEVVPAGPPPVVATTPDPSPTASTRPVESGKIEPRPSAEPERTAAVPRSSPAKVRETTTRAPSRESVPRATEAEPTRRTDSPTDDSE
ncbi:hypothetical protein LWF15_03840 [Kineosporia rhizophila]|uniref:hypothetical protein n=1 Tax=Kineosporia TaxID=49184 RepID=UPI001E579768|nr:MULTISPECIES: hypothetical protein [Kineosporia]MCE0534631.1 hypothetical protein [Kineosporia rhizophila]GLY15578.1 hypothetical protein Kisp01_25930 [Kineosporia sp. NBRC 101677]